MTPHDDIGRACIASRGKNETFIGKQVQLDLQHWRLRHVHMVYQIFGDVHGWLDFICCYFYTSSARPDRLNVLNMSVRIYIYTSPVRLLRGCPHII